MLAVSSRGFADTITLKNGAVITGKVVQSNEKTTTVEISTDGISKIEYGQNQATDRGGNQAADRTSSRKAAIMWNPVPTLALMAMGPGLLDIELEAQLAAAGWLTLYTCLDVAGSFREPGFNLRVGPKFRFSAAYLI